MTLKNAKILMDDFYDSAIYRLDKKHRNLYEDHVLQTFEDKCDAIITACIFCNAKTVWQKAQEYKFELRDKLLEHWYSINEC